MAVYTHLSDEEMTTLVSDTYGLGELTLAIGIADGVENSNYLLLVEDEEEVEQKYILTLYEKRVAEGEIPFFLNLMQHLATHEISCPLPVPRCDGTLHGEVAGKQAAIVTFLEGKSRTTFDGTHTASAGEALAKLHLATAGFPEKRMNALALHGWQKLFNKTAARLDEIQAGLKVLVEDELLHLSMHMPSALSLPRGVIHADFFPDNVFFVDDQVSGIIDFYFACEDFFAYDLAIAMNAWCFESGGEFNRTKSRQMLSNYQRIRPLNAAEKTALPVLMRGAALRFLLTRAHDFLYPEPSALVTPRDPLEYVAKLKFHQQVKDAGEYGV